MRGALSIVALLALLLSLFAGAELLSKSSVLTGSKASVPTGVAVISVTPTSQTVATSSAFSLNITLDPRGASLSGIQFVLNYPSDANDFQLTGITLDSGMVAQGWSQLLSQQTVSGAVESIAFAATHNGSWGANGPVKLATVNLMSTGMTSKLLSFNPQDTKATSGVNSIDVLLTPVSTATVNVVVPSPVPTLAPSPSPVPTPISTPTPTPIVTPPDTTPPTEPTNLVGTAVSGSQINLSWTASTDNVGVTGYTVFRNGSKLVTIGTTSFGDTGLTSGTSYSYYVTAQDAAGNVSGPSSTVTVTTLNPSTFGQISGTVSSSSGGPVKGAKVVVQVSNKVKNTAVTNSAGGYAISGLNTGVYNMSVTAKGYIAQNFSVTVVAGQTTTQNVTLGK